MYLELLVIIPIYSPEEKKWNGDEKKRGEKKKERENQDI